MSISDLPLWKRIENFDIDEVDIDLPFSKRLARENSWPGEFALRVIEEYKKFIYLTCISEAPVTPSDEVDQAWHLHLTYTRSYWDQLCDKVLGRRLHHNPTKGGKQESNKFEDWYAHTKTLYEKEFDTRPPQNIWPPAKERFSRPLHMKRVDTSANFVFRKPLFSNFINLSLVVSFLALFLLSGATVVRGQDPDPVVIGTIILGFVIVNTYFSIYLLVRTKLKRVSRESGCGGCGGCGGGGCGHGCGGCGH